LQQSWLFHSVGYSDGLKKRALKPPRCFAGSSGNVVIEVIDFYDSYKKKTSVSWSLVFLGVHAVKL
jgi:hypothetical protein